ncbi:sensor histidine kinase [Dyadobacter sp. CY356]|uniref:sensor histidine kinase n=1 Tax=Dyadobacter sp. CY356 TaxID=2906442 RepID=UPI001F44544C|nr:histidine kinase [Dyadobacter sp. CY356]MCF0055378.1 histidine kinase [Dyadobacter sp. CY356]
MAANLSFRQKWQVAIRLLILYSPLMLYVNLPESFRTPGKIVEILPFILLFETVVLCFYFVCITATDWVQTKLHQRYGEDFLLDFNWLALILTMVISLTLSLLYSKAFQWTLYTILSFIFQGKATQSFIGPHALFTPEVLTYMHRTNTVFNQVIMLSAFYLIIMSRSYQQLKDVQIRAERSEKEAALSQFEALKSQISPHFLFNSLSILTSMVHEDADLSEKFVKQLSKVYRYILEQRDHELVSLETELEFIKAYTFLLQIRFENKFEILVDISAADQKRYQIPPLTLQLLVENAVKHNRMSVQEPLKVHLFREAEFLVIQNTWQPREQPETSTGIGLPNIINRYALFTDQKVLSGHQNDFFTVKIPLLS